MLLYLATRWFAGDKRAEALPAVAAGVIHDVEE
jgi:hypothetical protein